MDPLTVLNKRFSNQNMFQFCSCSCVLLWSLFFDVFGFITKHLARFWWDVVDDSKLNSVVFAQSDNNDDEEDEKFTKEFEPDEVIDKGFSEFSFGFKFGNIKDLNQDILETECPVSRTESSVSKYEFLSSKDVSGFIQSPEPMSFSVEESFGGFIEKELILYSANTSNKDLDKQDFEGLRKEESDQFIDFKVSNFRNDQELVLEEDVVSRDQGEDNLCNEEVLKEKEVVHCDIYKLSENIDEGIDLSFLEKMEDFEQIISPKNSSSSDEDLTFHKQNFDDIDDEFIELGPHLHHLVDDLVEESATENLHGHKCDDDFGMQQPSDGLEYSEEQRSEKRKSWDWESDEEDEEDILMEHKYLIEQMKLESKHSRVGGLPTILEESETPKMSEDLKPLQLDQTFEHSDHMEEIQKFYKSYSEKMRKMDILNYQTMHAISFIQLKEPVKIIPNQKSTVSAMKSMLMPNFNPGKLRKIYADQTLKKSTVDFNSDLERVYVGQVCVSWEILRWQYTKAQELQEYDSQDCRSYNQVAGDFQQFQVLLQRFIEDELFQGPRVKNYVSRRHVILSLLQVPMIKDDCVKNKSVSVHEAVSIPMLKEIIEESMRVFWEFIRVAKPEATAKRLHSSKHDHQDAAADLELLIDVKSRLQKMEKRLKEVLRTSNCIVKKLQKHQGGRVKHDLLICQVELKLVSRVLQMSRCTTDQLIWCQSKLNKINCVNRKFSVEPSFLLFPC